jgi:hypothetical protein
MNMIRLAIACSLGLLAVEARADSQRVGPNPCAGAPAATPLQPIDADAATLDPGTEAIIAAPILFDVPISGPPGGLAFKRLALDPATGAFYWDEAASKSGPDCPAP